MEGNFRIVQYSESEYGIEKEYVEKIIYNWWRFKKPSIISEWSRVDLKGNYPMWNTKEFVYSTTDLDVCSERLRRIKEFPKVIAKI